MYLVKNRSQNNFVIPPEDQEKTLKTAWEFFKNNNLSQVYGQLLANWLLKIAVILPVTSASAERVHKKLKLVKSAMRSTSADLRMSDLIQSYVEYA